MINVTYQEPVTLTETTWLFKKFKEAVQFLNEIRKVQKGYFCLWFDVLYGSH